MGLLTSVRKEKHEEYSPSLPYPRISPSALERSPTHWLVGVIFIGLFAAELNLSLLRADCSSKNSLRCTAYILRAGGRALHNPNVLSAYHDVREIRPSRLGDKPSFPRHPTDYPQRP